MWCFWFIDCSSHAIHSAHAIRSSHVVHWPHAIHSSHVIRWSHAIPSPHHPLRINWNASKIIGKCIGNPAKFHWTCIEIHQKSIATQIKFICNPSKIHCTSVEKQLKIHLNPLNVHWKSYQSSLRIRPISIGNLPNTQTTTMKQQANGEPAATSYIDLNWLYNPRFPKQSLRRSRQHPKGCRE